MNKKRLRETEPISDVGKEKTKKKGNPKLKTQNNRERLIAEKTGPMTMYFRNHRLLRK